MIDISHGEQALSTLRIKDLSDAHVITSFDATSFTAGLLKSAGGAFGRIAWLFQEE